MLTCLRFSSVGIHSTLFVRHASSIDLSTILHEQSALIEKKSSTTIAFETFIQTPAEFVSNAMLHLHDSCTLPWWATIGIAACTFRFIMGTSVTIVQQRLIERLQLARHDVNKMLEPRIKILNRQAMQGKTATIVEEKKHIKREVINRKLFAHLLVNCSMCCFRPFN
jgi:hypothetical protein